MYSIPLHLNKPHLTTLHVADFKTKTGNTWEQRGSFVPQANKYTMVEIEHDQTRAAAQNAACARGGGGGAEGGGGDFNFDEEAACVDPVLPCTLDAATQGLMNLIFDEDMMKQTLVSFKLDPKRLPLGALSESQLTKGEVRQSR